jgi:uncharacterized protein
METLNLKIDDERLADICRRYGVKRLALFGSALREDFGPDSDVDVLYEFLPGVVIGWDIVDLENELSELFGGRKVDLVPFNHISPYLRRRILKSAREAYAA